MADQKSPEVGGVQITHQTLAPDVYFNGMDIRLSLSDISIVLMTEGRPQCTLRMSFTTAKTLANDLSEAISHFEQLTEHPIMTMSEVKRGFDKVESG